MLLEAEDGRALGRLVAADALEDAGAVVQRVGEDVDLGLGPGHELAVHPDLVDLGDRHGSSSPARSAGREGGQDRVGHLVGAQRRARRGRRCRRCARPARGPSRRPSRRRAPPRARRSSGRASWRRSGWSRTGWRAPGRRCRAPSRGWARRGRRRRRPTLALGSMPMLPVSIAASSVRMSPNRFSVAITSNCLGSRMSCMAQLSTSMWRSSTSG